jgi:hypothetical protein
MWYNINIRNKEYPSPLELTMTFTPHEYDLISTEDVLGYILVQNAARNAQAKAEGWEFWTTMPVNLDFVAEFKNAYELELMFAKGTYSDAYKEWCGCRPSAVKGYTLSQLEEQIENLSKLVEAECKAISKEVEELDRMEREEIALGMKRPASNMKLEKWEIYEAKAEVEGY